MWTLKLLISCGIFLFVSCEHFEFGDIPGEPCILLDIDAKFNLTYTGENKTEIAPEFSLDGAEVVNASCICGDEQFDSVLTLRIFPTGENVKFKFGASDDSGHLAMSLTLSLHPQSHFQDLNDSLPVEIKDSKDLPAGMYANESYVCKSEQRMVFHRNEPYDMTVTIKDLQVQAYLVDDAQYGPIIECPLDSKTTSGPANVTTVPPDTTMTTEPHSETTMTTQPHSETTEPHSDTTMTTMPHSHTTMTTMPPITTQPARNQKFVLRNGKQVCVVLQGTISFEIPYIKTGGMSGAAMVNLPAKTAVGGSCNYNGSTNEQEIQLSFYNGWELSIIIVKEGSSSGLMFIDGSTATDYSWQKVMLTYVIDEHFPEATNPGTNNTVEQIVTFGQFKAGVDGSYKCDAKQQVELQTKIKLDLSNFQYRAFGTSTSDGFSSDDVSECAADGKKTNNDKTLAIVLGAGFGGLAVLIILAGVILKCRRQRQRRGTYDEI